MLPSACINSDWLVFFYYPTGYLANGYTAKKRRIIQRSNLHL